MKVCHTIILLMLYSYIGNAMAVSPSTVESVINRTQKSDFHTLNTVPLLLEKIDIAQSNELRDALANSLIHSTPETLDTLKIIDKKIDEKGHSFIIDKLGTDSICGYMIDTNQYNRDSFFKYYATAKFQLEKLGARGKKCLTIMNDSVAETLYEEKKGTMKWGVEKYDFIK